MRSSRYVLLAACLLVVASTALWAALSAPGQRTYVNKLVAISDPQPILADYPEFVEPIRETVRFEAPPLIDDEQADLEVRAWRFTYNVRGIIEMPCRLRARDTAVIVVHPWGIDDGHGWNTPEPAGIAFQCTVERNQLVNGHMKTVINPLLQRLRAKVGLVLYSLPGTEDPIRQKIYRSFRATTTAAARRQGEKELAAKLKNFDYHGQPVLEVISVSEDHPVEDYFKQFGGTDASDRYNGPGFWKLPIPVNNNLDVALDDVAIYDAEGYPALRDFLKSQGIRHVLLTGYNTDMCFCETTAGYKNLGPDFNVFLVGDATIATFPANPSPKFATNASISLASREHLITQASWIRAAE